MNGLEDKQLAAIKFSTEVGRRLQIENPEIANDYRAGKTITEIIEKYDIGGRYSIYNRSTQVNAVSFALRGSNFNLKGVQNYGGLISQSEMDDLHKEHLKEAGKKRYEEGSGAHSLSNEEKGNILKESLVRRGLTLWTPEERKYVFERIANPKYLHVGGGNRDGRPNYVKIAEEINVEFHSGENVRVGNSVKLMLRDSKRKLE